MTTIVAISDLHIGAQTGLCPPSVALTSGAEYKQSELQRIMYYRAWLPFVDRVQAAGPYILILNGDILDLNVKHNGTPLISMDPNNINDAAGELLDPLIKSAQSVAITRGTPAHVGTDGCYEETLGKLIDKDYPGKLIKASDSSIAHPHLMAISDDKRYDIAHHVEAGVGKAQTTRATYAIRVGVAVYNRYIEAGERLPNYVIRGHYHTPSEGEYRGIKVKCLPGWQWPTEYVYRLGGAEILSAFGGLIGDEMVTYTARRKRLWVKI